jgi:MFS family permease
MDLVPEDRRRGFLGVWSLFMNAGQIIGPLVVGTTADAYGFTPAFLTVTVALVTGAVIVLVLGKETVSAEP